MDAAPTWRRAANAETVSVHGVGDDDEGESGLPAGASPALGIGMPNSTELTPGTKLGEYVIEGKVGQGGMGVVYGATHPVIGKRAAIKVMRAFLSKNSEAVERFVQEARSIGQLGHPNIVDAFSFGVLADGACYYMMEWLKGESLAAREKQGRIPLDQMLEIIEQVCRALEAAHQRGIIHRDLKPDNVFLVDLDDQKLHVKLLDFGIAKLTEGQRPGGLNLTKAGVLVGTPAYMSPEQARGLKVDPRADVYSLGVMAFEAILGRLPFDAENKLDIVVKQIHDSPPMPSSIWPEIPVILDRLLVRMLQKDATLRPSLAEIRGSIGELRGAPVKTPTPLIPLSKVVPAAVGPTMVATPPKVVVSSDLSEPSMPSAIARIAAPIVPITAPNFDSQVSGELRRSMVSEVERKPRRRSNRKLWIACAAAITVGATAGLVAAASLRDSKPRPVAVPAAAPPAPVVAPVEPPVTSPALQAVLDGTAPEEPTAKLVSNTGTMLVRVDGPRARVKVDGHVVGESVRNVRVEDEPGAHVVVVSVPGREDVVKTVTIPDGMTIDVVFTLAPEEEELTPPAALTDNRRHHHPAAPKRHSKPHADREERTRGDEPSGQDDDATLNPYPRRSR